MSLYHDLEQLPTSSLDDLAEQIAELVEARRATENAVHDQAYRTSADAEAMQAGARQDSLTAELEKTLLGLFPQLREPAQLRSAA